MSQQAVLARAHSLFSLTCGLLMISLLGCGGGGDDSPTGETDATISDAIIDSGQDDIIWQALETCDLVGYFEIDAVAVVGERCDSRQPQARELIVIKRENGIPRLRISELYLAVVEALPDCNFRVFGCQSGDNEGKLKESEADLYLDNTGVHLTLRQTNIANYRLQTCGTASVDATKISSGGCGFAGRYRIAEDPRLTAGMCDLTWPAGEVDIRLESSGIGDDFWVFDWESQYLSPEFDESTCSFTVTRERFYNGANRHTQITGSVDGNTLHLTVADTLEEADDLGNNCVDAIFEATAVREFTSGEPWGLMCEPPPYVCGDGVCSIDTGENCFICRPDCGCDDNVDCLFYEDPRDREADHPQVACMQICDDETPCGASEQCVLQYEYAVSGQAQSYCLPSLGDSAIGGPCTHSLECAEGLICETGVCRRECVDYQDPECDTCEQHFGRLVCHSACGPDAPNICGDGNYCAYSGEDACTTTVEGQLSACYTGMPSQYNCAQLAETDPTFGNPCDNKACMIGFSCVQENCLLVRELGEWVCQLSRCSRECADDSDCEAPLPHCWQPPESPIRFCIGTLPE